MFSLVFVILEKSIPFDIGIKQHSYVERILFVICPITLNRLEIHISKIAGCGSPKVPNCGFVDAE